ncbi:MAG TPA: HAD family phosphatase [Gemmatimonadaceae bacterium]
MLDTVLFELEGVIADTGEARRDAIIASLRADGVIVPEAAYRDHCAGLSFEDAVRAAGRALDGPVDETAIAIAAHRAERAYRAYIGKGLTLVEGARETLERLHGSARLGLVTRAPRDDALFVLSLARMDHLFTCVVAAEDAPPKPSPEPYRLALSRLQRARARVVRGTAVALEDGRPGIQSARAAGIPTVIVGDLPAHVALEADAWLPSLAGATAESLLSLVAPRIEPNV